MLLFWKNLNNKLVCCVVIILLCLAFVYKGNFSKLSATTPKFLDQFPGAKVAYSLHKINSQYSGPMIKIRRGSDNATKDIGLDINGQLNVGEIEQFALGHSAQHIPGGIAPVDLAYSIRKVMPGYLGPALRLKRSSGGEADIGFDQEGRLDLAALEGFLDHSLLYNSTLPLDTAPGAAAAYSVRRLSSTYFGPLLRVRRTSDGAELDINFVNPSGELSLIILNGFCAASDCTVSTWYDQSGNSRHAVQADPNMQPKIYDADDGVVLGETGKPSIEFLMDQLMAPIGFDTLTDDFSFFVVRESIDHNWITYFSTESVKFNSNRVEFVGAFGDASRHELFPDMKADTFHFSGADFYRYYDSELDFHDASMPRGGTSSVNLSIGMNIAANNDPGSNPVHEDIDGKICELISYASDQLANRQAIIGNQGKYFDLQLNVPRVVTLYDQSGNAYDASSVGEKQPILDYYSKNGKLDTKRTKILFNWQRGFDLPVTTNGLTFNSAFAVFERSWEGQGLFSTDTNLEGFGHNAAAYYDDYYVGQDFLGSQFQGNSTKKKTVLAAAFNANGTFSNTTIGEFSAGGYSNLNGSLQELILYTANQSSNRQAITLAQDIGYQLSAEDIYVETWYDQSGNGIDATQLDHTLQPRIYTTGQGFHFNSQGKHSIHFASDEMSFNLGSTFTAPISVIFFARLSEHYLDNAIYAVYNGLSAVNDIRFEINPTQLNDNEAVIGSGIDTNLTLSKDIWSEDNLYFATYGANGSLSVDGNTVFSGDTGTNNLEGMTIGRSHDGVRGTNAFISDFYVYAQDIEENRSKMQENIKKFQGLPLKAAIKKKRRNFARQSKIRRKLIVRKIDKDGSNSVDYDELVLSMYALYNAKQKGNSEMTLEELQAVDFNQNNTFDEHDEKVLRKELEKHDLYDFVDSMLQEEIKINQEGGIKFKTAKKLLNKFTRKKTKLQNLENKGLSSAEGFEAKFASFDCNDDGVLNKQDRLCMNDLLTMLLKINYPEKLVDKFINRRK